MNVVDLRLKTTAAITEFAWGQWAQMGVLAHPRHYDDWAQDPEALLVFTLRIARHEPRLFDEILDWLRHNGALVSGRRLARLADQAGVQALVQSSVAWAAGHGSTLRLSPQTETTAEPVPLFPELRPPTVVDEIFGRHGFLKATTAPSFKSSHPDLGFPINFAFRLRLLFGVGSRAEIIRYLLTSNDRPASTLAVAEAAVSVKRNVNNALSDLVASGDVKRHLVGNEARYSLDRSRWADFLGPAAERLPAYRDWPRLLWGVAEIADWLDDPRSAELDDYLRASEARALVARIGNTLTQTGITVSQHGLAEEYWTSFVATVEDALGALSVAPSKGVRP